MEIKTVKQFCSESNQPAALIRAVVRQVGGFDSFKEMAEDVTKYGAGDGFNGFIYYSDTVRFTRKNKAAIVESLESLSDDLGGTMVGLLCGFNCFKDYTESEILNGFYNPRSEDRQQIYNGLAWYALEEVARSYVDLLEE